ncbi:hypothetical protein [Pseudorhodoferax sp. Leaf267]|nr:hypothetical protein [Pseudorhodoferax sp. Leaf267]
MARGKKIALYAAAMTALAGTFALYLRPDFLVDLSNQVWACF